MLYQKKTLSDLSDEQLIPGIINGHHAAFSEIYKRYSDRMLYYFYRMLGNSNEKAQDFLQDLFVKLIEKAHLFDKDRRFSTWFFSIAYNMCKNEYRRLNSNSVISIHKLTGNIAENLQDEFKEPAGEDEAIDPEMFCCRLFEELDAFDELHKSVFLLHYREGFSIKDIGQALEISEGTVKSRLFYTRRRLSEKLAFFQNYNM